MNRDPFNAPIVTVRGVQLSPSVRNVARETQLEQEREMAAKLIRRGKVMQALALLEGRREP